MGRAPILDEYFAFLCGSVRGNLDDERLEILFETKYFPLAGNDINRVTDGKMLREEFLEGRVVRLSEDEEEILDGLESNLFEVLAAFARRAEEIAGTFAPFNELGWFWEFVRNLERGDGKSKKGLLLFVTICNQFVTGRRDGYGRPGPFFASKTPKFWKKTELWYQFQAFLDEFYPI